MDEEITIDLNFDVADAKEKFGSELQEHQEGPVFEVIGRILKATTKRKVPANYKICFLKFRSIIS